MEMVKATGGNLKRTGRPFSPMDIPAADPLPAKSGYAFYRKLFYLKNGKRLMLRFLHEGDRAELISLFQEAPPEDLRFCKNDLTNVKLLHHWLDHLDSPRLLPLVSVDLENNRIIAAASLLRGKHTAHHIGEVKLFISKPFRNLGLGSKMLDELIQLATQEKLHWLRAEVVTEQKQMIKALRSKGFQIRVTLEDFFVRQDGVTHDVALLMRSVNEVPEEL